MDRSGLALVLHAHLPFVRSAKAGSLEEDWLFQALMECYLPILQTIESSAASNKNKPKLTISLSPTLLSLLINKDIKSRFPVWMRTRIDLLKDVPTFQKTSANHLADRMKIQLDDWIACDGDLVKRFAFLQKSEILDLLTCAATHGYLPLLREHPQSIRGQLNTAVEEHKRLFGIAPLGIWLPECAYFEGLDRQMSEVGLRYAVLDGHGLLHASPRPRYGLYAPICTKNGVAFFGRDSYSTLPVWSAKDGYPGNSAYREFHKDLGWELSNKQLKSIGLEEPRPLGLKLHKVTSQSTSLDQKDIYKPDEAEGIVKKHAKQFLADRKKQILHLKNLMEADPILVAPFDAELFGHWWFEGPLFLKEIFKQSDEEGISLIRLIDVLKNSPQIQLCEPSPSSWGKGGYHDYWLNETNAWIIPKWNEASAAMIDCCKDDTTNEYKERLLKQAARELLLAQSSDWSFILKAGTTTQLAKERINRHLERFWDLIKAIKSTKNITQNYLSMIEKEDCLFPNINPYDWSN